MDSTFVRRCLCDENGPPPDAKPLKNVCIHRNSLRCVLLICSCELN